MQHAKLCRNPKPIENSRDLGPGVPGLPSKFLASCHLLLLQAVSGTKYYVARLNSNYLALPKFWAGTPLLVTTSIQMACISLVPSQQVPQYLVIHTALSYLMFNLPVTKSSQQHKTARHRRSPMKTITVILILGNKHYYRVVTVLIRIQRRLHFRSFQNKL